MLRYREQPSPDPLLTELPSSTTGYTMSRNGPRIATFSARAVPGDGCSQYMRWYVQW